MYVGGATPEQAAEQVQVLYWNTRPAFERMRPKRWATIFRQLRRLQLAEARRTFPDRHVTSALQPVNRGYILTDAV
jgi:hypothetical protein